jgi:hypothetical protein
MSNLPFSSWEEKNGSRMSHTELSCYLLRSDRRGIDRHIAKIAKFNHETKWSRFWFLTSTFSHDDVGGIETMDLLNETLVFVCKQKQRSLPIPVTNRSCLLWLYHTLEYMTEDLRYSFNVGQWHLTSLNYSGAIREMISWIVWISEFQSKNRELLTVLRA